MEIVLTNYVFPNDFEKKEKYTTSTRLCVTWFKVGEKTSISISKENI